MAKNGNGDYFGPSQTCKDPQMHALKSLHGEAQRGPMKEKPAPPVRTTANDTVTMEGRGELEEEG